MAKPLALEASYHGGSSPLIPTKFCPSCKLEKPFSSYSRRTKGASSYCKSCQSSYCKEHYKRNKAKHIARKLVKSREHRLQIRAIIQKQKAVPCKDCNKSYPYYVMDFDHLENKKFGIGRYTGSWLPIPRLLEELTKCEVVCSNCHRIRSFKRQFGISIQE